MSNEASADLVIVTDDKGRNLMDTRRAMRLLYGDGARFIGVQSHEDLVAQLGRYSYIGRLVITLHGSTGTLNIRGYGHDLEQYGDDFKAAHVQTKVNEIFFRVVQCR